MEQTTNRAGRIIMWSIITLIVIIIGYIVYVKFLAGSFQQKTYSNKTYGFSTKYPSNWLYWESANDGFQKENVLLMVYFASKKTPQNQWDYSIEVSKEPLDQAVNKSITETSSNNTVINLKQDHDSVDGEVASKITYDLATDKSSHEIILVSKNAYTFIFKGKSDSVKQSVLNFIFE